MLLSDSSVPSRSSAIPSRALRANTNSELERIVRDNLHDPVVLRAVLVALKGRTRKKAIALRTEICERLGLDHVTGAPSPGMPIWERAAEAPRKPWYRKWSFALTMLGFVGAGVLHGVGFHLWQMVHQGLLSLGERFQLF